MNGTPAYMAPEICMRQGWGSFPGRGNVDGGMVVEASKQLDLV